MLFNKQNDFVFISRRDNPELFDKIQVSGTHVSEMKKTAAANISHVYGKEKDPETGQWVWFIYRPKSEIQIPAPELCGMAMPEMVMRLGQWGCRRMVGNDGKFSLIWSCPRPTWHRLAQKVLTGKSMLKGLLKKEFGKELIRAVERVCSTIAQVALVGPLLTINDRYIAPNEVAMTRGLAIELLMKARNMSHQEAAKMINSGQMLVVLKGYPESKQKCTSVMKVIILEGLLEGIALGAKRAAEIGRDSDGDTIQVFFAAMAKGKMKSLDFFTCLQGAKLPKIGKAKTWDEVMVQNIAKAQAVQNQQGLLCNYWDKQDLRFLESERRKLSPELRSNSLAMRLLAAHYYLNTYMLRGKEKASRHSDYEGRFDANKSLLGEFIEKLKDNGLRIMSPGSIIHRFGDIESLTSSEVDALLKEDMGKLINQLFTLDMHVFVEEPRPEVEPLLCFEPAPYPTKIYEDLQRPFTVSEMYEDEEGDNVIEEVTYQYLKVTEIKHPSGITPQWNGLPMKWERIELHAGRVEINPLSDEDDSLVKFICPPLFYFSMKHKSWQMMGFKELLEHFLMMSEDLKFKGGLYPERLFGTRFADDIQNPHKRRILLRVMRKAMNVAQQWGVGSSAELASNANYIATRMVGVLADWQKLDNKQRYLLVKGLKEKGQLCVKQTYMGKHEAPCSIPVRITQVSETEEGPIEKLVTRDRLSVKFLQLEDSYHSMVCPWVENINPKRADRENRQSGNEMELTRPMSEMPYAELAPIWEEYRKTHTMLNVVIADIGCEYGMFMTEKGMYKLMPDTANRHSYMSSPSEQTAEEPILVGDGFGYEALMWPTRVRLDLPNVFKLLMEFIGVKAMVGVLNRDTHRVFVGPNGEEPDLIINSREFSDKDSLEIVLGMMNMHESLSNGPLTLSDYAGCDPAKMARKCPSVELWNRTARGEVHTLGTGYYGQLPVARSGAASENSGYRFLKDYQLNMLSSLSLAGTLAREMPLYGLSPEESDLWAACTQPNTQDAGFSQLYQEREIVKAILSTTVSNNQEEDGDNE